MASYLLLWDRVPPNSVTSCKIIKLRKVIGKSLVSRANLGLGKEFLDLTAKTQSIKGRVDKLNLIKDREVGTDLSSSMEEETGA